jgi:hypothetical protein
MSTDTDSCLNSSTLLGHLYVVSQKVKANRTRVYSQIGKHGNFAVHARTLMEGATFKV